MIMGPVHPPQDQANDLLQNLTVSEPPQLEYAENAPSQDGNISDSSGDASVSSGDYITLSNNGHEVNPDSGVFYSTNGYASHAAYGSYDYTVAQGGTDWEEYPRYVGLNGLDPSMYLENGAVVYQQAAAAAPGYGFASYYAPNPYVYADGQLYGHPFAAQMYQGHQYTAADASKGDGVKQSGGYPVAFMTPYGHFPRGVTSSQNSREDPRQDGGRAFEGLRATAPAWVDTRSSEYRRPAQQHHKPQNHQQSQVQKAAAAAPAFPGALGTAFPPLTRAVIGKGGGGRVQNGGRVDEGATLNESKNDSRVDNGDLLSEQNRGPRTLKLRSQRVFLPGGLKEQKQQRGQDDDHAEAENNELVARDEYNKPDFPTSYKDAKFYIIKSYSEDDVHKSIKYGVWASTPNGNRRLDAAYQEAQGRAGECPVFLFFSVNASGQFCGVAEMTGPVDFVKSMDFWQQDKWSGRFSAKWHIIKDIPNGHFRHIILENNDNKPVTNSRDTQEVQFGQGLAMLKIFKNFPCNTSILDDFQYYESRQKAMQEKRSRQSQQKQQHQQDGEIINCVEVNGSSESGAEKPTEDATVPDVSSVAGVTKKSYLRSLAGGDKDVASSMIDVKAA